MKTRYKLLMESYDLKGVAGFIFNSLQSVLSDFLFGISCFFIFNYIKRDSRYQFYGIILIILIFIYFIFLIPLWGYLMERCENIYKVKLTEYLFENKLKKGSFENEHSSVFLSLLQHDVEISSQIAGWDLAVFFQAVIAGSVSSVIIGILSYKMLFILYAMGIIAVTIDIVCSKYIGKLTEKNRSHIEKRLKYVIDFINNILIIKIYNQENKFRTYINKVSEKITENKMKINIFENITNLINNMIYSVGFKITVIVIGLKLVVQKEITFGALLLIFSMIGGIAFVTEYMGGYIKTLRRIGVSNKKIDNYIEKANIKNENRKVVKFEKIEKIELKNVNFKYYEEEREIFNNLNVIFQFPNNYIILGDNGSGKSTLLKLLFGIKSPTSGEIYIDGKKINEKDENLLPFGFVPQQVSVYNESIIKNIKMGTEEVSDDEIRKAVKILEAEEWINSLEKGIYTEINEKGKNISKGEKTRLAISRELIKNPEILFLDEPDSNIDKKTMESILKNIRKNYPTLSLVIITHLSQRSMYEDFKSVLIK
ncbi:ABC transporter ATP-binding protein [Leptotrichia sp. OH3620_COT-345]|uniref:ATP-binding cassette domain-containing protein n=1 Tax=Leptotrichia sp. OH3620_COT-345 TaxID=2491048 RepID=UPI000F655054|nr:ABC transporter ATP-binding protein [Leptotrichia sp. OH3620_COT-345]RRD39656.1 ABC transporter ATP-binding protein [Leptotrichia sp. OH3620_COT-345]